jgi:hypothetical protein
MVAGACGAGHHLGFIWEGQKAKDKLQRFAKKSFPRLTIFKMDL